MCDASKDIEAINKVIKFHCSKSFAHLCIMQQWSKLGKKASAQSAEKCMAVDCVSVYGFFSIDICTREKYGSNAMKLTAVGTCMNVNNNDDGSKCVAW